MTSPNTRSGTGLSLLPAPAFSRPATSFSADAALLRGGRLRKTSRGIFTFAPALAATASAIALGALLSLPSTPASAQTRCTGTAPVFTCNGTATATESLSANSGTLLVTDLNNFTITTTSGNAFTIMGGTSSTGMTVTIDANRITAGTGGDGINADHDGSGAVAITAAAITAAADGIEVNVANTASTLTINANGDITATAGRGIYADHLGTGALTVNLASGATILAGNTTNGRGIHVKNQLSLASQASNSGTITVDAQGSIGTSAAPVGHDGISAAQINWGSISVTGSTIHATRHGIYASGNSLSTSLSVTATGDISADRTGIDVYHSGSMAATVTVNAGVTITAATGIDVDVNSNNVGSVVDLRGTVNATATPTATAITLTRGASQRLILNPGFSIGSGDLVTASRTDAVLELKAADGASADFDLSTLSTFTNFVNLEKTEAGTWTLTGMQPSDKPFSSANVAAGTLRLGDGTTAATLELGTNALTLSAGTTLEVMGMNTITGNLDNSAGGSISLAVSSDTSATDDTLSVVDFTAGGSVTMNVAFNSGDDAHDSLTISGMVTGTGTTLNLEATGTATAIDSAGLTLVTVPAATSTGAFTLGSVTIDGNDMASAFALTRVASGNWILTAAGQMPGGTGGGDGGGGGGGVTPPPMPVMPECEEQSTMGSFTCRGAFTEGQTLAAESGESLNVMTDPGFSITTDTGNALTLTGAADSTGMVVSLGGATISSTADDGIGIDADHAGSGDVTITASGAVSGGDTGIDVTHSGSGGNVSVTADDVSGSTGISAAITGTDNTAGSISVTVGGRVSGTGTTEGDAAIAMSGGASQSLTLNTGARVSGDIVANAVAADAEATTIPATLTLAGGSGSSSLNLSTLSGFSALEKTGNGTWELTGVQGTMDGFTNANVRGGTLRLNDATLRPGANTLTIASGAILEVIGESTVAGALSSSGAISLAVGDDGTDEQLTVSGTFSGTVTMNADLANPESPAADQLVLDGSGSNSVTLNLRVAANEDLELTPAQLTALQNALIGGSGSANITAGDCVTTRTGSCSFTATGGNLTALTITLAAADAAVYESYASTLTELARLQSRQQRLSGRTYSPGQPVWGQIQAGNTTLEPATSSEGSVEYDLQDIRARFGFDVPLHHLQDAEIFPITLGMNAWIAQGDSDITASNGTGTLESDAFGFAATATLEQADNGIYADAQLQYAAFSSDMASGGSELTSNQGADSFSASAEVGMRLPALHGFTLTPQVQLVWSDVEFDDFRDSKEVLVSLADGETLTARLGLAAEHALQLGDLGGLAGDGIFRAAADLHLPLDGKTGIRIAEESFTSDLQEVAFSLSAGAVFSLTEAATLSADLATTHGSETETYRASLTTRLAF